MNKKILVIAGVAVFAIAGIVFVTTQKSDSKTTSNNQSTATKSGSYKIVNACKTLTRDDAVTLLGAGAAAGTSVNDTSTDDINVSTCSYTLSGNAASLLARSAKSSDGAKSNQDQFANLPSGAVEVSGYGDKAYWDPNYGQFNILKNKNWYILSYGPVRTSEKTIEDGKKIANVLVGKL